MSYFKDVCDFHKQFELPHPESTPPRHLSHDDFVFRFLFLVEELKEYHFAVEQGDLVKVADALADIVYVALGTAAFHGIPFDEVWAAVHRANMDKIRTHSADASKRGSAFDVIKPPGWRGPEAAISQAISDSITAFVPNPSTND